MYHMTRTLILELLDREIKKTNGTATVTYQQDLVDIKQNFLECLDRYEIKTKVIAKSATKDSSDSE